MLTLDSLLYRGYFLRELPPSFTSEIFADVILNNANSLPAELGPSSSKHGQLTGHNVVRLGITRRNMFVPNPIPYLKLSRELANNWGAIQTHCQQSQISKSQPTDNTGKGRAIITTSNFDDILFFRSKLRSTSKYILKTDIAKFYPSLYSHSISWALHTKTYAKTQQRNMQLLGNQLDLCVRNCQDKQTMGIPIGPDSSLVISEIVLTATDMMLQNQFPGINGMRYVDDYEFGFQTYTDAEKVLGALQQILQSFELSINFAKTKIVDLPLPLDPMWILELRNFNFKQPPKSQRLDLVQYISKAFDLANTNQDEFVMKYAVNRLRGVTIDKSNWDLAQEFLFQCVMVEPSTFLPVLERLMDYHQKGYPIDRQKIDSVMNYQIAHNGNSSKGSEVAWALWAMIFWNVPLSGNAANAISRMEDSFVALLALDARQRGLIPTGLDTSLWETFMTDQELYGNQWLLAYEANIKNWLPSATGIDYVANDPAFGFLKSNNVEFYDPKRLSIYRPASRSGAGVIASQFSYLVQEEETEQENP